MVNRRFNKNEKDFIEWSPSDRDFFLRHLAKSYASLFDGITVRLLTQWIKAGEVKRDPDIAIATTDGDFKIAIELILDTHPLIWFQSRLTRLRQMGFVSVIWYVGPPNYTFHHRVWLWTTKQEFYLVNLQPNGAIEKFDGELPVGYVASKHKNYQKWGGR